MKICNSVYIILFNALVFLLFTTNALSAPTVNNVDGVLNGGGVLTLTGQNFGVKLTPAPRYYSGFEDEVVGELPAGWLESAAGVAVSISRVFDGTKALEVSFAGGSDFSHIRRDLGEMDNLFFTAHIYFEKNDSCSGQWKAWRITSSPDAYNIRAEPTTISFINDYWYRSDEDRWYNNSSFVRYNGGDTIGATVGVQSDLVLLGQWQRMEQYVQGSSAPLVADGYMWTKRIGRDGNLQESSGFISRNAEDKRWRYFMIGQAWGQHSGCDSATSNVKVYYDNVYIDDTQARVEVGDAPVWADCTYREIQIPTSWKSDGTSIDVAVNQGSMSTLSDKYLFVVDADGNVSPGFPLANVGGEAVRPMPPRDPKMN